MSEYVVDLVMARIDWFALTYTSGAVDRALHRLLEDSE
jgi:hypothetical protein